MSHVRLLVRCIWVHVLAWTGCLRWAKQRLRDSGAIVMLTFHRVLDEDSYQATHSLPGITIRECTFRDLVKYLVAHYELASLVDAVPGVSHGSLRIGFTFDDGWRDNFTTAFPILSAFRVPVTIFICPGVLGMTMPFWPERAVAILRSACPDASPEQVSGLIESLKRQSPEQREYCLGKLAEQARGCTISQSSSALDRTLSWDEIIELHNAGVQFGSHTDTHQILTVIPASLVREELQRSKASLERVLDKPCQTFAYPNGDWSPETRGIVETAGFARAVTTQRGAWTSLSDPLAIPRSNVCESSVVGITGRFSPAMFEYSVFWKAWRASSHSARPLFGQASLREAAVNSELDVSALPHLAKPH